MKEGLIYISIFAAAVILLAVQAYKSRKQSEALLRKKIRDNWGNIPNREYEAKEFENISHYYEQTAHSEYNIDDITWNDLNMDSIFKLINNTYSSVGEEYLYKMLREPQMNSTLLNSNEKLVSYFEAHADISQKVQRVYAGLGRTRNISMYDFLYRLNDLGKRSNIRHYVFDFLFFAAIGLMYVSPPAGIIAAMVILGINVISYFSDKAKIESFFICFRYLVSMITTADKMKIFGNTQELEDVINKLNQYTTNLKSIRKGSSMIIGNNMSGSLMDVIMDYVRMILHVDLIKFNKMLNITVKYRDDIDNMFLELGRIEACLAIASFRKMLPDYCIPEFITDKKPSITFEEIFHPCIEDAITNDIDENRCVLITGSNASGKSTFLKTVAINAIMAQTINTCSASVYKANYFQIYSSMALRDDLSSSESYYMVEIKSLKRIVDKINSDTHILCFVDEVLRGTNTIERIAASTHILKYFADHNVLCFAATHDIELTHILEDYYSNYHFQEEVENGDVLFNYKLYEGRATSRNAIRLLGIIGYNDTIIKAAEKSAADFVKNGNWTKCY